MSHTSSGIFSNYQPNNVVIEKLIELDKNGWKINLFIGKCPSEGEASLPNCLEKEVWVSLGIDPAEEMHPLDRNRLHLVMHCDDTTQMKKIEKVFQHVVINISTIKFLHSTDLLNIMNAIKSGGSFVMPNDPQFNSSKEVTESDFHPFQVTLPLARVTRYQNEHYANQNREIIAFCQNLGPLNSLCKSEQPQDVRAHYIQHYQEQILTTDAYKNFAQQRPYLQRREPQERIVSFFSLYTHSILKSSHPEEDR